MQLMLKVTLSNNQTPKSAMQFEFNESGGTIGRKISNSWVLPDENRHLSGSHSKIEYDKGVFYIVDTSTNGVFVNGNSTPLGKGNRQKVDHGDQLVMGTYSISVSIVGYDSDNKESSKDTIEDASTKEVHTDDLFADLLDDPIEETPSRHINKTSEILEVETKEKQYLENSIGSDDPFFESGEFSLHDDQDIEIIAKENHDDIPDLDSFFKPANVVKQDTEDAIENDFFTNKNDDVHLEKEEVDTKNKPSVSVIPDDWITDDISSADKKSSIDNFLTGIVDPFASSEAIEEESVKIKEDKIVENTDKEIAAIDLKEDDKKIKEDVFKKNENDLHKATEFNLNKNNHDNFLETFFEGMGVEYNPQDVVFNKEDAYLAGKLFRKSIEGTMEVLQSRAEIKNEMRMDMTTIRPIENNPIKFSITAEEAITKLLLEKSKSQMDSEKAMDEAYDDIRSHQVAVISGIQAALTSVLKRFEPENLIERLERQSPISASIPIHRKAKLWEAFEYLYQTIEGEAADDFNRLFGQEFAKAYDDQVEKLKNARGNK